MNASSIKLKEQWNFLNEMNENGNTTIQNLLDTTQANKANILNREAGSFSCETVIRQGLPFSLLVFYIVVEVLTREIRQEKGKKGRS